MAGAAAWLALGLPFLLLLGGGRAAASRISYEDVSLGDAVARAPLIVCAQYRGEDPAHFRSHRFRVGRVVSGRGPSPGQEIHVFTLEAWAWDMVERAHRATGVFRSPLLPRLPAPPSAPLQSNAFYCLLLTSGPGPDYHFAVSNGQVPAPCGEVARLVATGQSRR